jgi:hypothetical protein
MKTIKRKDGVKLTHYFTKNKYKFYKDEIGKRFVTLDGIVFTPYTR